MEFATLRAELACNAESVKRLLAGIPQAETQRKPAPDSWSMLEVVIGWVAERNYNQQDFAGMIEKWVEERRKSLAWLDSLSAPDWEAPTTTPFGSMKAGDMFVSWVTHDILHMRQLVELRHTHVLELSAPYAGAYAGDW